MLSNKVFVTATHFFRCTNSISLNVKKLSMKQCQVVYYLHLVSISTNQYKNTKSENFLLIHFNTNFDYNSELVKNLLLKEFSTKHE